MSEPKHSSWTIRIVDRFLRSHLSPILIIFSLVAGGLALLVTPREEEPQIVIPAADLFFTFPGRSAAEMESLAADKIEKYLYQIDGVEYVYSRSMPGRAIVTVRFYVGQDRERSYVKLSKWLQQNADRLPAGLVGPVVKPVETDDVPIVTFTLTDRNGDDYALRRLAEEAAYRLQATPGAGVVAVIGGRPRQVIVRFDPVRLAAFHLDPAELARTLPAASANLQVGSYTRNDQQRNVETGQFLTGRREVQSLIVGVFSGRPVYLRDVAEVQDGPGEFADYVHFSQGPAWRSTSHGEEAEGGWVEAEAAPPAGPVIQRATAVTIAISKQKGQNNVSVAQGLIARMRQIQQEFFPAGVRVAITRNYGVTADDKVNELSEGLLVGIVVVIALLTMFLGFRDSLVVAIAVPCVFGLTLLMNYLFGFSINRVTLFALTVSLGLLVDDPIVDVENIRRHFDLRGSGSRDIVLEAVNEVRPPLIAATIAVMISFAPLLFVTEEMHDYLRPMAVNVPVTMFMSMLISFTVTPWLAYHVLRGHYRKQAGRSEPPTPPREQSGAFRFFHRWLEPMLQHPWRSYAFLLAIVLAFFASLLLVGTRRVQPKQLPFDDKDEFLLVLDMPAGTPLERTDAAAREFEEYLSRVPEVTDVESYVGTAAPVDFNGLARRYQLRHSPDKGDIRVNLIHKTERRSTSHEITLRLRDDLTAIARRRGVKLKIVELPPGPPTMSTVTAAIYGRPDQSYPQLIEAAEIVKRRLAREPGVVDLDDTVDEDIWKEVFMIDKEKAALNGITGEAIASSLRLALAGTPVAALDSAGEKEPLQLISWMARPERSGPLDLSRIYLKGRAGAMVAISELGRWERRLEDKTIYHRNLERVVYVTAEMAGRPPVETILDIRADQRSPAELEEAVSSGLKAAPRPLADRTLWRKGGGLPWAVPEGIRVQWWDEGEMRLTIAIFRDLGWGFLGALLCIYILLVNQTGSFGMPVIIMLSIPLMVIGVFPGYWLLNLLGAHPIGHYADPRFFTSPAMIGVIALSGIVTRNSIIIVDFVHLALAKGRTLIQALVESCAVRLRPILLTSGAAMLGAWPITRDEVFNGLGWSLIFGLLASTLFSLFVIPVAYHLIYARRPGHGLPETFDRAGQEGQEPDGGNT